METFSALLAICAGNSPVREEEEAAGNASSEISSAKKNINTSGKSTQGPPYRTERLTNDCTNCGESRSEAADAKNLHNWVSSFRLFHTLHYRPQQHTNETTQYLPSVESKPPVNNENNQQK